MNKLITGVGAILAFCTANTLIAEGSPVAGLLIATTASSIAIALIVVEWARV